MLKENKYLYYYQENINEVLDLQDELSIEEIGMFIILKSAYFKTKGVLAKDKLCQLCKFFGNKNHLLGLAQKIFVEENGMFINQKWNLEITGIIEKSIKRSKAALTRWEKEQEAKDKPKRTKKNPIETQDNPLKPNGLKIINENYIILSDGLIFILEAKMKKKLPASSQRNFAEEIRKLIEIDLKERMTAEEDVRRAIQAIGDNYGKDYFPIIESGKSFRSKFSKIENYRRPKSSLGGFFDV